MQCYITFIGVDLDPDSVVKNIKATPDGIYYKGQLHYEQLPNGRRWRWSMISFTISEGENDDIKAEIEEACRFISDKFEDLRYLAQAPGVTHATLTFGSLLSIDKFSLATLFPARLLKLAGDAGLDIELCTYPVDDEEEEVEA